MRPYLKTEAKRAGGMVQVVEHLPSKFKVLSSNCQKKKVNLFNRENGLLANSIWQLLINIFITKYLLIYIKEYNVKRKLTLKYRCHKG
jgi:hypothetical protein